MNRKLDEGDLALAGAAIALGLVVAWWGFVAWSIYRVVSWVVSQ